MTESINGERCRNQLEVSWPPIGRRRVWIAFALLHGSYLLCWAHSTIHQITGPLTHARQMRN
jgi:hypothetical protein